jgi:fluoroquinolone transport system permease protein
VAAAFRLEGRIELRYGIVPVAAGLAVLWTAVLLVLPAATARILAPYLLFTDTAGFGALFVVVLLMFERTERARDALAATPLRTGEAVVVRVLVLTVLSVCIAVPLIVAAVRDDPAGLVPALLAGLSGVALITLLLLSLCLAVSARARTLQDFLVVLPFVAAPLVAVPLVHMTGLWEHPLMYAVPTTVGADLVRWGIDPGSVAGSPAVLAAGAGYALVCAALALVWARRAVDAGAVVPPAARSAEGVPGEGGGADVHRGRVAVGRGRTPAVLRFARADLFGTGRDPMLLVLLLAPLPLAVAVRFVFAGATDYVRAAYGTDLASATPLVLALFLLHMPTMFGAVGGMRAIEDVDDRVLMVLRVSPLTLGAYLAYRMSLVAVLTLGAVLVALPLSGLMPGGWSPSTVVALVLGTAQAPLLLAAVTAFAANKVESLVAVKAAGAALVVAPVLAWVVPGPWNLLLLALPPTWPALAVPGFEPGPLGPWALLAGGLLVTGLATALLVRRTAHRLDGAGSTV